MTGEELRQLPALAHQLRESLRLSHPTKIRWWRCSVYRFGTAKLKALMAALPDSTETTSLQTAATTRS